ncbi:hypothetical protein [Novispirillum itersonii]|uniref:hypothetical protein n=1 Tax=Novispirillum itersonii TaxID=189 RepID=UPI000365BFF4|nr:hypothetical protein [Novispirillum itersonii]
MIDVEEMVDATAAWMWQEMVVKNGKEGGNKPPLWDATPTSTKREWRCAASHAMQSLEIPLETLAALKAGTWRAVPVDPTSKMLDVLSSVSWCEVDDDLYDGWAAMLDAAPRKPRSSSSALPTIGGKQRRRGAT